MKPMAIVCNIGHFDSEIQIAALSQLQVDRDQAAGRPRRVPRRQADHRARQGPPGEPRLRDRPPVVRDVGQLHQPGAGADRAVDQARPLRRTRCYVLPKHLDEKVAALHLDKLGVKLTKLTREAGRLHRRVDRRPVQAGPLPLLSRRPSSALAGARAVAGLALGPLPAGGASSARWNGVTRFRRADAPRRGRDGRRSQ